MSQGRSEHEDMVFRAVQRLFALYERGNDPQRAGAYARALVRLPIDRLERAIEWAETTWEQKSPPPVPWLLRVAWHGKPGTKADEQAEQENVKVLRYYLEHFSMADWYEFRRSFGYAPTEALYVKLGLAAPAGVTFVAPDPAWCKAERERQRARTREAFRRLNRQHGIALPEPDAMTRVALGQQRAENADLPF